MRRLIFQQPVMYAALAVFLALMSVLPGSWVHAVSSRPRHIIESVRAPFAAPLQSVATSVRRPPDRDRGELYGSDPDTQYDAMLRYARSLEIQIARLQEELEIYEGARMRVGSSVDPLVARVSGGSPANHTITIDRGTLDGVYNNMAVASDLYLVGRVVDAGPKSATVQLILSPGTNLMALIKAPIPPDAPGLEERSEDALLQVSGNGKTFYYIATNNAEVQSGDFAHLKDSKWHEQADGFVIGKVTAVEVLPENTLERKVVIEPLRSLSHLSHVVVLRPYDAGAAPSPSRVVPAPAPEGNSR